MAGTAAPASEEGVGRALAAASEAGEPVVLRGGGTRLGLGAPARASRIVDLGGLSGVIEHHVSDLTVEAWAGTTVGALNRELAPHRQLLALDPPLPERATLGGVIAAGDPGFRVFPGSRPRDLLLGLSAVLADGTRIRSGGRVVKNVTGYELTKLFTGSLGTLGAITRVTLRLRALPEASRTVVAGLPVSDAVDQFADRVLAAAAAAPGPAAVAVVPPGTGLPGLPEDGGFRLAIRFEGLREEAAMPPEGVATAAGGVTVFLGGPEEEQFWAGVRDFPAVVPEREGALGLAVHGPPGALLRTAWRLAAFGPPVAFPDQRHAIASIPAEDFEAALGALQEEPDVSAVIETAPGDWKRNHPVFHPPPSAAVAALSSRIKAALDPEGILAPGRMPF
ncbi:MAG: FAD-binding oxidoreductase [Acidobacteria bacterium]|nr:FAD-binding oxidoreductase [Acidobacteriota bacterium]MYA46668.1 FAD-binding oxidoreductase [Acidobacteriota bacterium]MYI39249.1 FAD-binding oxidoreductase [Acidobacteriota bacterium]